MEDRRTALDRQSQAEAWDYKETRFDQHLVSMGATILEDTAQGWNANARAKARRVEPCQQLPSESGSWTISGGHVDHQKRERRAFASVASAV